jgi:hypothetical protein
MKRYLQQLHSDIELAIQQAPPPTEPGSIPNFYDEDTDFEMSTRRPVRLCELFQIVPEAFPPEKMLSDEQLQRLLSAINNLWKAWNLFWEMPLYLSDRKKYTAMVREMGGEPIKWTPERGGEVIICRFEQGGSCPFGPENSFCFCQNIEESIQEEMAIWEEHLRSKGFDPRRELSPEEEIAFEMEIMIRELQRMYGEDWEKFADADLLGGYQAGEYICFRDDFEDEFSADPFLDDFEEEIDDDLPPSPDDDLEW